MVKKSKLLSYGLAIVVGSSYWIGLGVANASTGSDHQSIFDSVDGGEIRWGGTTKYSSYVSTSHTVWENVGRIDFAKDTATTIQDLTYDDVYTTEGIYGRWTPLAGADKLIFNDRLLQNASSFVKNHVAAHEAGHALGIKDHGDSKYNGILMSAKKMEVATPQSHDKSDYNSRW
ncbi:hypothetical protein JI667_14745 [Bacillus sp. NTK074B]|uniref:hypothetical protein n=1 Tax=Bacillus sp. NTK074B TaxID=2802174 RepID=UPI001A8D3E3E|nr:hypothetical protein [Bacillus sp. NTK074B]